MNYALRSHFKKKKGACVVHTKKIFSPQKRNIRVVGKATEQQKEKLRMGILSAFDSYYDRLPNEEQEMLRRFDAENPKTKFELDIIEIVNEIINEVIEGAQLHPFDVPPQAVHIVPGDIYEKINTRSPHSKGSAFYYHQIVLIRKEPHAHGGLIGLASIILHELGGHLKSFIAVEASIDDSDDVRRVIPRIHRSGMRIEAQSVKKMRDGLNTKDELSWFRGLDEAVVTELEKKYLPKVVARLLERHPEYQDLKDELEWFCSDEALTMRKAYAKRSGIDLRDIGVSKEGKVSFLDYFAQRKVLRYILEILLDDNRDKAATSEEVFGWFVRAHYGGNLVPLGRLIDKSFGAHAFKALGFMDQTPGTAHRVLHDLMNRRKKIVNKRSKS